jgi:tRNA 2-thiouridine synthesizing protein E
MEILVQGRSIPTDEEGFLLNPGDWTEDVADIIAKNEGFDLKDEHMGLVDYFREYWAENEMHPTMHLLVKDLGGNIGKTFHDHKAVANYIYEIFPREPIAELCKLAGLPKPLPSEREG